MVIDIAESLITILKYHNTKKEFNKALLLLKLTICNFFENLIYFWVTLYYNSNIPICKYQQKKLITVRTITSLFVVSQQKLKLRY